MTSSLVGNTFFGLDLAKISSVFSQFRRRVSKRVLLIECGISSINFAEVKVHDGSISLDHIRRYPLPEEAMERGIPTDPAQMASLIKGHCEEEDIPAHRAAVVIPTDAAFTTLVQLPADVNPSEALAYALDPASSVQVPIQLDQTDAELIPVDLPQAQLGIRHYFLTAVPRKLIDRLLETINLADLELIRLQIGTISQLNQLQDQLSTLSLGEVTLHVELLRECSLITMVTVGGPIRLVRLTAIRDFPEPEADVAEVEPNQLVSTERQIVASDRYLPLSELDIRRLAQELSQAMQEAELQFPWIRWRSVVIAGPNSAHPLLATLLHEALNLPVDLCRPLAVGAVASVQLKQPILVQRLGRLVGLGLSFLDRPTLDASTASKPPEIISALPVLVPLDQEEIETAVQSVQGSESTSQFVDPLSSALDQPPPLLMSLQPPNLDSLGAEVLEQPVIPEAVALDKPLLAASEEPEGHTDLTSMFSFSTDEDIQGAAQPNNANALPPLGQAPEALDDDLAKLGTPFSMGDLLTSFEARKQDEMAEQISPLVIKDEQVDAEAAARDETVYLADDPSLWPSVAKESSVEQAELD